MRNHRLTIAVLVLACLQAGCRDRHEPTKPTVAAAPLASPSLPR